MQDDHSPDEHEGLEDIEGYVEKGSAQDDADEMSPRRIAREVGDETPIADHVEGDVRDQCGYCGQEFGPDDIVVERTIYGKLWRFCDERCLGDFLEHSNFRDQDLDSDDEQGIGVEGDGLAEGDGEEE